MTFNLIGNCKMRVLVFNILKSNVAWQEEINQIISTYINNKKHLKLINRPKKLQSEAIVMVQVKEDISTLTHLNCPRGSISCLC